MGVHSRIEEIWKKYSGALPVLISEVWNAAIQMKSEKAPDHDGANIEFVEAGGHEIWKAPTLICPRQ